MKIFIAMMILISNLVWAQSPQVGLAEHNGGNGGDTTEISLKNTLIHIAEFTKSNYGRLIFKDDFNPEDFEREVRQMNIRVQDSGLDSCSGNIKEQKTIQIKRSCTEANPIVSDEIFILLMRESLLLQGLDGSISNKLYPAIELIRSNSSKIIFTEKCTLNVETEIPGFKLSQTGVQIIKSKGFKLDENSASLKLLMEVLVEGQDFKKNGNTIQRSDSTTFTLLHSFSHSSFNGLVKMSIPGHLFGEYAPVQLKIKKLGAKLIGDYASPLLESLLNLPSCRVL